MRLSFSYFSLINLPPSSDEAIAIILAQEIAEGSRYPLLFIGQPYQFPIEAYLMAPLVNIMPNNALGARYLLLILGAISTLIFLYSAWKIFPKNRSWPSLLLILIPSAYWLTWQSAYAAPQYAISSVFAALLFYFAWKLNQREKPEIGLTIFIGIIAGLSLSNHLLLISIVIGTAFIVIFNGSFIRSMKRLPSYLLGLTIGLTPLLLALYTIPNAYEKLSSRLPLDRSLARAYETVLQHTLPATLGANPPYFGDYPNHLNWGDEVRLLIVSLFSIIILITIVVQLKRFFSQSWALKWPKPTWPDMFIISCLLSIFLTASSARGSWSDHRYLLPIAWSFPFLIGYLYSLNSKVFSRLIGGATFLLATFNTVSSSALIHEWRQPQSIQHHADIPDLTALQAWMNQQNIDYCYATFWLAYRVTYESDSKPLCAPIYNERFSDWPVPYKAMVDQKYDAAFVMSNTYGTKFSATKFQHIMDQYGVQYQRKQFGSLFIYYDFKQSSSDGRVQINPDQYILSSSISNQNIERLSDNDENTLWSTHDLQQKGQFIEANFKQPKRISSIVLHYPSSRFHAPRSLRISAWDGAQWLEISNEIPFKLDRMRFERGHPIFGQLQQTMLVSNAKTQRLRIQIDTPEHTNEWDLSEIRFYSK